MKEIRNLMNLKHPNITAMKEYKTEENRLDIIQEYCDLGDLKDLLKKLKFKYTEDIFDFEDKYNVIEKNIDDHRNKMNK